MLVCILAGLVCIGAATPARSDAGPAAGRQAAAALASLFAHTCFRHAGDVSGLRQVLVEPSYRTMPDRQAAQLLSRPGKAWRVVGPPGHLMVLSFDDGWCGDGAPDIDPHALTLQLAEAMRGEGASMRLMGAGLDGNEQRYLLTRRSPARPIVLLVLLQPLTISSGGRLMQASLFAAPLPPETEPP